MEQELQVTGVRTGLTHCINVIMPVRTGTVGTNGESNEERPRSIGCLVGR